GHRVAPPNREPRSGGYECSPGEGLKARAPGWGAANTRTPGVRGGEYVYTRAQYALRPGPAPRAIPVGRPRGERKEWTGVGISRRSPRNPHAGFPQIMRTAFTMW